MGVKNFWMTRFGSRKAVGEGHCSAPLLFFRFSLKRQVGGNKGVNVWCAWTHRTAWNLSTLRFYAWLKDLSAVYTVEAERVKFHE